MNGFLNKESIHFKKVVYMKKIKKLKKYIEIINYLTYNDKAA